MLHFFQRVREVPVSYLPVQPFFWRVLEVPVIYLCCHFFAEGRYQMMGGSGELLVTGVTREDAFTSFTCRVRDQLGGGRELTSRAPAKIIVQGEEEGCVIRVV